MREKGSEAREEISEGIDQPADRVLESIFAPLCVFHLAVAFALANAAWIIWSNRFVPFHDYPDFVYEGWLLSRIISGHRLPGYSVLPYPVPYSTALLATGLFDLLLAPEFSGKLTVSLIIGLFVFGSIYLLKSLNRSERSPLLYVPLLFVFNCVVFRGEIAYLAGIAAFFLYTGYLFRRLSRVERIAPLVILLASCTLFFTHIAGYAAAGLVTVAIVVTQPGRETVRRLLLPFLPSGGLLLWSFAAQKLSGGMAAHAAWQFWDLHQFAGMLVSQFSLIPRFLPWLALGGPAGKSAAAINAISCTAMVLITLAPFLVLPRARGGELGVPVANALCLSAAVATGYAYGLFISPGERFLYPAAWIALCWVGSRSFPAWHDRLRRIVISVLFVAMILQAGYLNYSAHFVSRALEGDLHELQAAGSRDEFCKRYLPEWLASFPKHPQPLAARLIPAYWPFVRLPYYIYLRKGYAAPIFPVGMLVKRPNGDYNNACGPAAIAGGTS